MQWFGRILFTQHREQKPPWLSQFFTAGRQSHVGCQHYCRPNGYRCCWCMCCSCRASCRGGEESQGRFFLRTVASKNQGFSPNFLDLFSSEGFREKTACRSSAFGAPKIRHHRLVAGETTPSQLVLICQVYRYLGGGNPTDVWPMFGDVSKGNNPFVKSLSHFFVSITYVKKEFHLTKRWWLQGFLMLLHVWTFLIFLQLGECFLNRHSSDELHFCPRSKCLIPLNSGNKKSDFCKSHFLKVWLRCFFRGGCYR